MKTKEDPKPFTDERFREYQEKDIRTTGKMLKFFKAIREAIIFSEHKKRYRSIGSGTVPSRKRLIVLKSAKRHVRDPIIIRNMICRVICFRTDFAAKR